MGARDVTTETTAAKPEPADDRPAPLTAAAKAHASNGDRTPPAKRARKPNPAKPSHADQAGAGRGVSQRGRLRSDPNGNGGPAAKRAANGAMPSSGNGKPAAKRAANGATPSNSNARRPALAIPEPEPEPGPHTGPDAGEPRAHPGDAIEAATRWAERPRPRDGRPADAAPPPASGAPRQAARCDRAQRRGARARRGRARAGAARGPVREGRPPRPRVRRAARAPGGRRGAADDPRRRLGPVARRRRLHRRADRHELSARDAAARAAIAALPGSSGRRSGGARSLLSYARSRVRATSAGTP